MFDLIHTYIYDSYIKSGIVYSCIMNFRLFFFSLSYGILSTHQRMYACTDNRIQHFCMYTKRSNVILFFSFHIHFYHTQIQTESVFIYSISVFITMRAKKHRLTESCQWCLPNYFFYRALCVHSKEEERKKNIENSQSIFEHVIVESVLCWEFIFLLLVGCFCTILVKLISRLHQHNFLLLLLSRCLSGMYVGRLGGKIQN